MQRAQWAANDSDLKLLYNQFSAVTLFDGYHRTIIYNDQHPWPRHRSNMAHELAHALLLHASNDSITPARKKQQENEANWMSGVMMLTAAQAWRVAAQNVCMDVVQARHGISPEMLRYRLNVTGAYRRIAA